MRSLLQRLGRAADRTLSAVIWLHDSVMLFISLFWLLPLIVLVVISAFIYDLRPLLRDHMQEALLYSLLLGLPLWIGVCFYALFAATSASHRIRDLMGRMPAYVGYVLLSVGGLLWLLGIISGWVAFGPR
jgi:hypothetical protein